MPRTQTTDTNETPSKRKAPVELMPTPTPDLQLWTKYHVTLHFTTRLCGSVPGDPELVAAWMNARAPKVRPPAGRSIEEIQQEVIATLEEPSEPEQLSVLVFQRHGGGCVLRAATLRAHLKDAARVLSAQLIGKVQGERAFSTRVLNGCYPDPTAYWIPITREDGTPVTKHDGEADKPIHVRGPRGEPLNALKRYQWIEGAKVEFTLFVLGKSVSHKDLEYIFSYGGVHGYGGERGDGEGKYIHSVSPLSE